jgi:hypothetical protein
MKITKSELKQIIKEEFNNISGGLSEKLTISDIAKKHKVSRSKIIDQLKLGLGVEVEHTDDPRVAMEISMDHLYEDPLYYTKLKKLEKQ